MSSSPKKVNFWVSIKSAKTCWAGVISDSNVLKLAFSPSNAIKKNWHFHKNHQVVSNLKFLLCRETLWVMQFFSHFKTELFCVIMCYQVYQDQARRVVNQEWKPLHKVELVIDASLGKTFLAQSQVVNSCDF